MATNRQQHHCTDADYIDSIEDPFFKSVAERVIEQNGISDAENAASANRRLEDLEIAIRKKLSELLLEKSGNRHSNDDNAHTNNANSKTVSHAIGIFWKSALDLCHHVVHHALASPPTKSGTTSYENLVPCRRLPYLLLSDCIEGLPSLEDAQDFWSNYVEPELGENGLFGDKFWSQLTKTNNSKQLTLPNSHLPFLKVANQFLKRLEHASNNEVRVEWKGRIMFALSKGFSIADKSALKSWGHFHANNGTEFESRDEFNEHNSIGVPPSSDIVEYNLYEAFWSLQNDFANPNKINVGDFIKRLRLILAAMESVGATNSSDSLLEDKDQFGGIHEQKTKYLTSSALLPSQIKDPAFRSSVVTQFLIVASHLGSESPPLKNALAPLLGRAKKLLKNDNPQLHRIIWESILVNGREDHWRTWKKQKCVASEFTPNFKRNQQLVLNSTAIHDNDGVDRQHKRRRLTKEDENVGIGEVMVSSLSRNFLESNDLIAVSDDPGHRLPTLKEHLEPYVEALDPESGIEDEYHPKNDSLFTWRAMRLYAKYELPLMGQCRRPEDLEKITREWYRQSYGEDIPGEMPELEPSIDNEDNRKKDGEDFVDEDTVDNKSDIKINDGNEAIKVKDTEMKKETENQGSDKDNGEIVSGITEEEKDEKATVVETQDGRNDSDKKLDDKTENSEKDNHESEEREVGRIKKDDSEPRDGSSEKIESNSGSKVTTEKRHMDKDTEMSKSNTISGNATENRNNNEGQNSNKSRKNKNDSQLQEKRPPREKIQPQNRGGGRRDNDGGRNNQERGRRDDGPPPRRRGDDAHQSRGVGRSAGESSYRGRSDGPPSRGGRYDNDYRGDGNRHHSENRGDRFTGERNNRPIGRDNHRGSDQNRGIGRSTGDSSYRGRSDGPPSRGGRYDGDDANRHHGEIRGDRRPAGRDSHRGNDRVGGVGRDDNRGVDRGGGRDNNRGGDRVGGVGRDDQRGDERGGDRNRRNADMKHRAGGRRRR